MTSLSIPRDDVFDGVTDSLRESDIDFFDRVYDGGLSVYRDRLDKIGFLDAGSVLDAGCGFGQWSFTLGESADSVVGIDVSKARATVCQRIATHNDIDNVSFGCSQIESLPFCDEQFDAIFSYSVVYFADFEAAAREFHRVLKPGGEIYICTNGLGKYLSDIVHRPNPAEDFDPRVFALQSIRNTLVGRTDSLSLESGARFMTGRGTTQRLRDAGFEDVRVAGEGRLTADGRDDDPENNFYAGTYLGFRKVFETMARKPAENQ